MNLAARLEALCEPMEIVLCEDRYDLIRNDFHVTMLDKVDVKGFGAKQLYKLDGGAGRLDAAIGGPGGRVAVLSLTAGTFRVIFSLLNKRLGINGQYGQCQK